MAEVIPQLEERCVCKRSVKSILGEPLELMTRSMMIMDAPHCGDSNHLIESFARAKTLFTIGRADMDLWMREHAATLKDNVDPVLTCGMEAPEIWGGEAPQLRWMTKALNEIVGK